MLIERLPHLGHRKLAGGALDESHPKPRFQLGNPAAQFGFWLIERPARRRKTTVVDHLHKPDEVVEILHKTLIVPLIEL
ncbi:hypothetical protein D3C87_2136500 [compost metagenome]